MHFKALQTETQLRLLTDVTQDSPDNGVNSFATWRRRLMAAFAGKRQILQACLFLRGHVSFSAQAETGPEATQRRSSLHCQKFSIVQKPMRNISYC